MSVYISNCIVLLCRSVRVVPDVEGRHQVDLSLLYVKILQGTPEESIVHVDSRPGHQAVRLTRATDGCVANWHRGKEVLCFGRYWSL